MKLFKKNCLNSKRMKASKLKIKLMARKNHGTNKPFD